MGNNIIVNTRYDNSGHEFGGGLGVRRLSIQKTGAQISPNRMCIEFEGEGWLRKATIYLDTEIAIPLARSLLSVAEGYLTKTESVVT